MFKDIDEYPSGKRWLDHLRTKAAGRDSSTLRIFPYYLFKFCTFAGKDPEQLTLERLQHLKSDDMNTRRLHEELLTQYIGYLQDHMESGKRIRTKSNTIATSAGAIRSFYKANYVPLITVYVPSGVTEKVVKLPTIFELGKMIMISEPRMQAWIACQKDSGISAEDLTSLNLNTKSPIYGTIKAQLMQNQIPLHVYLERGKGMSRGLGHYDTYFGIDGIFYLKGSLGIKSKTDLDYVPKDTPLFNFSEKTANIHLKKVSKIVMGEEITSHTVRKYFNTFMKLAKVNESVVEYWMGHSLGKVKSAYFIPPVQEQVKLYLEAYPHIAIPRK